MLNEVKRLQTELNDLRTKVLNLKSEVIKQTHNYTVGDCFSRYDGALYRLSISSNLYYAIFVNLRLKGKTFNKFHPVNEVLTIMDQVEFVDYLNDNDLIYKGPFEKVYSLNTSKGGLMEILKDLLLYLAMAWTMICIVGLLGVVYIEAKRGNKDGR